MYLCYNFYSTIEFIVFTGMRQDSKSRKTTGCSAAAKSPCVQEGLQIFGDAWTLFIVRSLSEGAKRFCALQRELDNLNPVTLTDRLKKLEKLGFVERKKELVDKLSVSYSLTKKGKGMLPVLREIEHFAKKYLE